MSSLQWSKPQTGPHNVQAYKYTHTLQYCQDRICFSLVLLQLSFALTFPCYFLLDFPEYRPTNRYASLILQANISLSQIQVLVYIHQLIKKKQEIKLSNIDNQISFVSGDHNTISCVHKIPESFAPETRCIFCEGEPIWCSPQSCGKNLLLMSPSGLRRLKIK